MGQSGKLIASSSWYECLWTRQNLTTMVMVLMMKMVLMTFTRVEMPSLTLNVTLLSGGPVDERLMEHLWNNIDTVRIS